MIEKAGIWQSEGSTVFKLRSCGMTKKNGVFVERFENEFSFRVNYTPEDKDTSQVSVDEIEAKMAVDVAKALNSSTTS